MQYVKINQVIAEQIEQGMLQPGQKLPSERKLAESFDTTRVTLREALSLLESDGLIYREDRRGWFIAYPRLRLNLNQPLDFCVFASAQGRSASIKLIENKTVFANKTAIQLLQLAPFSEVHQSIFIGLLEKRPVSFSSFWLDKNTIPDFFDRNSSGNVLETLAEQYKIQLKRVDYQINTQALLGEVCHQLNATPGTPGLVITRTFLSSEGKIIAAEKTHWRHDILQIDASYSL